MQDYYQIVIPEQELHNLNSAIEYRQQIIDFVNAGQSGIVIYFSGSGQCPQEFLDILFGELIQQYGRVWFINNYIMIDADNELLIKNVMDFVDAALQSAMNNEMCSTVIEAPIITRDNWQQLPVLKGRVATEEDFYKGDAMFFINAEQAIAEVVDIILPQCVIFTNENNEQISAIIVQAEQVGNDQIIGMYTLDGTKRVGFLTGVTFVEPEILFGYAT